MQAASYRDGRGAWHQQEREEGAWQENYDDYQQPLCRCGARITWRDTDGVCLRCYARSRRS